MAENESLSDMFSRFTMEIEDHPFFVAMVAIAAGVIILFVFGQRGNATAAAALPASTTSNTAPVSDTPVVYNQYPVTQQTITPTGPSGLQGSPIVAGPVGVTYATKTVRAKTLTGIDANWDKTHSGVPIRSQPSGSAPIVTIVPFGSQISVEYNAFTGMPNQKGGSSLWYATTGGYISRLDIAGG